MGGHNHGFAPGEAMPRGDVTGVPTLLQELLDQAQRNPKAMGNLGTRALLVVVRSQNSFSQIQ